MANVFIMEILFLSKAAASETKTAAAMIWHLFKLAVHEIPIAVR